MLKAHSKRSQCNIKKNTRRCSWHRWWTFIREYLREFSKKFEMVSIGYAGIQGKLIYEKTESWKSRVRLPWSYQIESERKIELVNVYFHMRRCFPSASNFSPTYCINKRFCYTNWIFENTFCCHIPTYANFVSNGHQMAMKKKKAIF